MNNPIFDRTSADVANNTLKGQYNWTDLNRVEKWCRYLADELTAQGIPVTITTKTDWTTTDMRTTDDMTRIKNNIVTLCNKFTYITRPYSNVTPWRYSTANRWEKVLDELRQFLASQENMYVYGGVAYGGEPLFWQNRFMHLYQPPTKDYTPVEFIESTGTQYIDTNIKCRNIEKAIIDFEITQTGIEQYIYGNRWNSPYSTIGITSSNEIAYYYGSATLHTTSYTITAGTRYTLTFSFKNGSQIIKIKPQRRKRNNNCK